jgi:hypothetical protein
MNFNYEPDAGESLHNFINKIKNNLIMDGQNMSNRCDVEFNNIKLTVHVLSYIPDILTIYDLKRKLTR